MQLSKAFNFDDTPLFSSPLHSQDPILPASTSHTNDSNLTDQRFYQEYRKIYHVSYHLAVEKRRLAQLTHQLTQRLFEQIQQIFMDPQQQKKSQSASEQTRAKRSRRTAQMIQKRFICEAPFCSRLYGSEGSLQQHVKLKHPQLLLEEGFQAS